MKKLEAKDIKMNGICKAINGLLTKIYISMDHMSGIEGPPDLRNVPKINFKRIDPVDKSVCVEVNRRCNEKNRE